MSSWKRLNHNGNLVLGLINCPGASHAIIAIVRILCPIMGGSWRHETKPVRAAAEEGPPATEPHLTCSRRRVGVPSEMLYEFNYAVYTQRSKVSN